MGVLDLRGPQFLALYVALLSAASLVALFMRSVLRPPRGDSPDVATLRPLQPLHAAYLAGGPTQAVDATIATLVHRDLVTVTSTGTLYVKSPAPPELDPFERHVHRVISRAATVDSVRSSAAARFETLRSGLENLGLLVPAADAWKARLLPALVVGAVLALGLIKMAIGMSRGRPVGFLAILVALTAMELWWLAARPPRRSLRGDRALETLRQRNAALQQTAAVRADRIAPSDLALAVGLFGPGVVLTGPLWPLGRALLPSRERVAREGSPSSDAGCGSSCSSSCGGGCGGGCGGCGS